MKVIKRSQKLQNVKYEIRGPVLDEANRMKEMGDEIISLNIGNPAPFNFDAPDLVLNSMTENLKSAQGYSDSKGIIEAREAIVKYYLGKGVEGISPDDVYTGNGASELIIMSMQALLNDGDEVLVPAPDYPLWTSAVCLAGGKPVHYVCDESANWFPDIADIRSKITDRTRGIVIINPNNPTGVVYPREIIEEIVKVAEENDLVLFSDEIYDRLLMDGVEHVSTAALAGDVLTVTFNGLSKSHLSTGFRSGWICISGDRESARDYINGIKTLASMRLCSNVPAQIIIPSALDNAFATRELYLPGGRMYEQREYIYRALTEIDGVTAVKPQAAFYIFPKLDKKKFGIVNDEQFAFDLLREQKVLVVSGSGFHWPDQDHFRIAYLPEVETLKVAMDRLKEFLSTYHQ